VTPSALAALRLTTVSNAVACWTGRSAGFSPLRIRPVWTPAAHAAAPRNNGPDAASEKGGGMDSVVGVGAGVSPSVTGLGWPRLPPASGGRVRATAPHTTQGIAFQGPFSLFLLIKQAKNLFPPQWLLPLGQKTNPPLLVLKPRRGARLPQQTRQWSASARLPPFPALWLQPLVLPGHAQDRAEAAYRPAAVPPRPTRRRHRRLRFEGRGPRRLRGLSHLHRSRLPRPKGAAVPLFA